MRLFRLLFAPAGLLLLLLLLPLTGAGQRLSPAAEPYFSRALVLLRKHALNRRKVDWPALEQQLRARAFNVTTIPETYPLLRLAVRALDDRHSAFVAPTEQAAALELPSSAARPAAPDTLAGPADVGYVRVPSFKGTDEQARAYVAQIRAQIRRQDQPGLRGWVIDLRGNRGGNLWVMLAALGPLLDEGVLGYFAPADGRPDPWGYRQGRAFIGRQQFAPLAPATDRLRQPGPAVAVLTDEATASSGEALAVAFRGRPATRSFGQPTYGIPTVTSTYTLSDGALLSLAVAAFADRTRRVYDAALVPDETLPPARTLSRAVDWLRALPTR